MTQYKDCSGASGDDSGFYARMKDDELAQLRSALSAAEAQLAAEKAAHAETSELLRSTTVAHDEYEAELEAAEAQLAAVRALLFRVVKYAREDKAATPGVTRLARALNDAEALLPAPSPGARFQESVSMDPTRAGSHAAQDRWEAAEYQLAAERSARVYAESRMAHWVNMHRDAEACSEERRKALVAAEAQLVAVRTLIDLIINAPEALVRAWDAPHGIVGWYNDLGRARKALLARASSPGAGEKT